MVQEDPEKEQVQEEDKKPKKQSSRGEEEEVEVVIRDLEEGYSRARRAQDSRGPLEELTLISGAVLNCGGPLSRAPAALASLKLGVGELGGFTGSGTRRLGPPELFPEPGATPPAPVEAATLGSFLWKENGQEAQRKVF